MVKKISLVIGAYNAQDTIKDLFDSIVCQELLDITEVILIDDCSKETYDDIISMYNDMLDIKLYRLPENHGIGYAKQFGIEKANGEYILFADADDRLFGTKSIKRLYDAFNLSPKALISIGYVLEDDISKCYDICLWGRMYKKELFSQTPIPDVRYNEDKLFDLYIKTIYSDKIVKIPNIVYLKDEPTLTKQYDIYTKQEWYFKGFPGVVENLLKLDNSIKTKTVLLNYFNFLKRTFNNNAECKAFIDKIDEAQKLLK